MLVVVASSSCFSASIPPSSQRRRKLQRGFVKTLSYNCMDTLFSPLFSPVLPSSWSSAPPSSRSSVCRYLCGSIRKERKPHENVFWWQSHTTTSTSWIQPRFKGRFNPDPAKFNDIPKAGNGFLFWDLQARPLVFNLPDVPNPTQKVVVK